MCNKKMTALLIAVGLIMGQTVLAEEPPVANEVLLGGAERVTLEAKVDAVDLAQRSLQLSLQDGQKLVFENISPKITHLEQMKLNDKVGITATKSMAFVLQKGGAGVRKVVNAEGKDLTAESAGILKTRTIYNDIVKVDRSAGSVLIKNLEGKIINVPVANQGLISNAEAGDQLLIVNREKLIIWAQ